jgi:homoserine O-acetyltransferase
MADEPALRPDPLDALVNRTADLGDLPLANGEVLPAARLAYVVFGTARPARDNVVLITHGFTASHHMAGRFAPGRAPPGVAEDQPGSWAPMCGPGRPLDTDRYLFVASNMIGSSFGSTGPGSERPGTGRPWGAAFPDISVGDIVAAQRRLLDRLGVTRLHAVLGVSYGGFQAFQWAVDHPDAMSRIVAINTAPSRIGALEDARAQIARLEQAPGWNGGDHGGAPGVVEEMLRIRIETLQRYGIEEALARDFPDPAARGAEIRRRALPWARAFDPNALIVLRRAALRFDAERDFAKIRARVLYALTTTDALFPPSLGPEVEARLRAAGVDASWFEIRNGHGHLGHAVAESPGWPETLGAFLGEGAGDSLR